jgi:hypothetical protein
VKASGIGRDGGDWSFEFCMEQKHVGFAAGRHRIPRLGACLERGCHYRLPARSSVPEVSVFHGIPLLLSVEPPI